MSDRYCSVNASLWVTWKIWKRLKLNSKSFGLSFVHYFRFLLLLWCKEENITIYYAGNTMNGGIWMIDTQELTVQVARWKVGTWSWIDEDKVRQYWDSKRILRRNIACISDCPAGTLMEGLALYLSSRSTAVRTSSGTQRNFCLHLRCSTNNCSITTLPTSSFPIPPVERLYIVLASDSDENCW